ncbi:MAG TPA: FkbM family methyltransferase, partial [Pyrinomonadaceae bacterium]
ALLWRREINVWDRRMRAASLDRLIALGLHRLGWMGRDEAILLRRLVKPGMRVIDVGANVGLYSLLLARLVGRNGSVLAFEPEPNLFAILRENCTSNDATNVVAFQSALGGVNGLASFHRSVFNAGDNRLGHASLGHDVVEVKIERFDDVQPDSKPDFVKIDVQGHELGALSGMELSLSSNLNVRVLFEFSPAALRNAGTAPNLLLEFFCERGFELYETEGACLTRLRNSRQLISDLRGWRYTNLLAARDAVETDD